MFLPEDVTDNKTEADYKAGQAEGYVVTYSLNASGSLDEGGLVGLAVHLDPLLSGLVGGIGLHLAGDNLGLSHVELTVIDNDDDGLAEYVLYIQEDLTERSCPCRCQWWSWRSGPRRRCGRHPRSGQR